MSNVKRRKAAKSSAKSSGKSRKSAPRSYRWLFFLLIVLFIALVWYLYHSSGPRRDSSGDIEGKEYPQELPLPADEARKEPGKRKPSHSGSVSLPSEPCPDLRGICYEEAALPELQYSCASQLVVHEGYRLSYNADYKVPNWVFYELTRNELNGGVRRSDKFCPDPDISSAQSASLDDYRRSGYDRGHIAPAADFSWGSTAMDESFYLSNMCPQKHAFNAGVWKVLEDNVRGWAQRDSAICIAAGPVLTPAGMSGPIETIGKGEVLVPQYFYKVVLSPFGERPKAIGFVMPNAKSARPVSSFAVSVDSVERLTMIDFFSVLPDEVETAIEAEFSLEDWF